MSDETNRAELPPDRLTSLWRRMKEHRIAQWTVGYVAVAYGIQHAVTLTSEAYEWPNIVARISMTLLALALPIAMTLAWYHGERASRRVSAGELSIISLLLVGVSILFYAFVRPEQLAVQRPANIIAATAAPRDGTISLAVLPFVNLSSDKEQEFFSDGITEEITAALAKIPKLPVVGRTSAFQFKGQNKDLRAIGQALNATYLLEGSVRKAGDRVRITAQLIRASDDFHVWTDSYDRELKDVFAVQEDVARAIAASLQVPLGLKQGETLVSNRNIDPQSYQQYLLARSLVRARSVDQALMLLDPVTGQHPDYAPASALLADAKYLQAAYISPWLRSGPIEDSRRNVEASLNSGAIAARRAIAADPKDASAYAALASIEMVQKNWTDAEDLFHQALALDPNDAEILQAYGNFLNAVGGLKTGPDIVQRQHALEPFVPIYADSAAALMQLNGQTAASIPILEAIYPDAAVGFFRNVLLANAYATLGRFNDAADTLLLTTGNQLTRQSLEDAARVLRRAPNAGRPEALPQFTSELNFVYAFVGAPERQFEYPERLAEIGYIAPVAHMRFWYPSSAPLRHTQRFKDYVRRVGLADYWRARGWPEFCHPTTGDDFECS
jgi:adenylate cyclase